MEHKHESNRNGGMTSRANIALAVFLTIGAVFLVTEHRAHREHEAPFRERDERGDWPIVRLSPRRPAITDCITLGPGCREADDDKLE